MPDAAAAVSDRRASGRVMLPLRAEPADRARAFVGTAAGVTSGRGTEDEGRKCIVFRLRLPSKAGLTRSRLKRCLACGARYFSFLLSFFRSASEKTINKHEG